MKRDQQKFSQHLNEIRLIAKFFSHLTFVSMVLNRHLVQAEPLMYASSARLVKLIIIKCRLEPSRMYLKLREF